MRLSVLSAIVVLSGSTGTKTKCTISLICFNQALILMRLVFNWACGGWAVRSIWAKSALQSVRVVFG